jgi:hypothetical protein
MLPVLQDFRWVAAAATPIMAEPALACKGAGQEPHFLVRQGVDPFCDAAIFHVCAAARSQGADQAPIV